MSSFFKRIFALSLEFVATSFFFAQEVQAQKTNIHQDTIGNIPSVSELSNVEISSWKFKFIEYFIQRYEIDIGYPLKTYLNIYQRQDNIKRAEFALIINKVIQHINQLQNNQKANFATEEELQTLTRLQSEFTSELDIVKDKIEQLEKNSFTTFSTTSTLRGESIFALTTVGKGKKIDDDEKNDSNFTLSNRIKIQLNTSFTGKDRLKTSFKTSNIKSLKSATGTDMARLTYQGDDDNKLELGDLTYRFPIGKKARVYIGAKGLNIKDFSNSVNPYLDGTGDGAGSRFGLRNPLFRQGGGAR
ncbi:MAG: iron uptake porin, partial [Rivularia sp. ALOHA_DT_140]|nr:iron uptake porin [Rivularia sp. ALOHA_DT_140]